MKMNRFLKVCMIKYDYEKIDKSEFEVMKLWLKYKLHG